ncbi:tail fiber protein [Flavobacterium sp. H4147]|uniref:tail fiber protein n=1 Tax=Flavobacterium sp. H4147 TaxID=3034149 RepID=UPI0023EDC45C|nr:tail fiber protein [Flavobacterium sp. H4147]
MNRNLLLIIVVFINQCIFAQTGGRRFFTKNFSVNDATRLELIDDLSQSLNINNIYKVQLVTTGTGTKTGAEYIVWNDVTSATWQIRGVSLNGLSSNHPLLIVEDNIVKIYTKHTNKYTVTAFVEEIITNENDVTPSIFGSANHWQRENTVLFYDGNVGLGTKNPDMRLTVNGSIHSKEVKVDVNIPVPDYVFKNDYNLKSLQEVENYIKENSHLPEIPSAKEFEKNGINVSEMNMNLLKKIEELTLYAIEQQKKSDMLMEVVKQQSKRLEALEKEKK